ncbi:MAG: hypothetical protein M3211_01585 [Actinomycetota bacterium]|nr:hypothetical protein [Actinomycetota bacterium]
MGDYDDFDLDRTTTRAWGRFQSDLADHVVAMDDGDVLVVDAESSLDDAATGAAPYVQFCAWSDDLVRAEVSSNEYLDDGVWLDDDGETALLDLGWNPPTHAVDEEADSGSANFYLDVERREADRLAAMAVAALRDVFGVPHPAFLSWPAPAAGDVSAGDDDPVGTDRSDEPLAVMPESADHLRTLAAAALTPPDGPAIEFDDEGDIPLPIGSALLWVRVHETAPVVELFSFVVRGAFDRQRAAFEVGVLNRDTRMVKFVLLDDAVLATVHLSAMPFAPRHLRALAAAMADVVDRVDDDLVARVGGQRALDPEPDENETGEHEVAEHDGQDGDAAAEQGIHPALLTLLHLDPEGEGVDPDLAASVCDDDRDLVLTLLTEASEQEIAWRKSGNQALIAENGDEARVCFHECQAWLATVETLRAALRVIVERRHAESSAAQAAGARSERGGVRRARRRTRPRQQSLVDDAVIRRSSSGEDTLFDPEP